MGNHYIFSLDCLNKLQYIPFLNQSKQFKYVNKRRRLSTGEDKKIIALKHRGRNPLMINNSNFLKRCNSLQSSICDFALCFVRKVLGQCGILGTWTSYIAGMNWRKRERCVAGGMIEQDRSACMCICACTVHISLRSKRGTVMEK